MPVGRTLVNIAAPRTTATRIPATPMTSRHPGCRLGAASATRESSSVTLGVLSATVGVGWDPDRRDEDLSGVGRTSFGEQSRLRPVERDGQIGKDGRVRRLTARKIDGGRRVDRDDGDAGRPGLVDELDRRSDRVAKRAADTCAKKRVDE